MSWEKEGIFPLQVAMDGKENDLEEEKEGVLGDPVQEDRRVIMPAPIWVPMVWNHTSVFGPRLDLLPSSE